MKRAKINAIFIFVIIGLQLAVFYTNCSGFRSNMAYNQAFDSSSLAGSVGLDSEGFSVPDANGVVTAYQDRTFKLRVPNGKISTTLPDWARIDSTTGVVSGIPHSLSSNGKSFSVFNNANQLVGTYKLRLFGNPLVEHQWHLKNTGQKAFALYNGTAGEDVHMSETVANNITGNGVRVAVSDTGVYLAHEALTQNVLRNESRSYLNNYAVIKSWIGDATPDTNVEENAHGTAVASLIAETGWNGIGGRGVAPNAKFAGFLFTSAQDALAAKGYGTAGFLDQFNGQFDIFNYSWGDPQCMLLEYGNSLNDKLFYGVTQQRRGLGSVYVMAGGNSYTEDIMNCFSDVSSKDVFGNSNFSELQTNPYIISVAAVNAEGVSSSYSTPGSNLWISAPGGEYGWDVTSTSGYLELSQPAMVTADFPGCDIGIKKHYKTKNQFNNGAGLNSSCNYTATMNGSSSAAPIVSGAVALLLQVNPNLSWRDVKDILAKTADKINPSANPSRHPSSSLNLTGYTYDLGWITNAAGFHFQNYYGFGRINIDNAVKLAKQYNFPMGTFKQTNTGTTWKYTSGTISSTIPDANASGLVRTANVTDDLVIEAVQLHISVDNCVGQVGIELQSPSGTKSILMNINSQLEDSYMDHTFLSNVFYGERSRGNWNIKIVDGKSGCTGKLTKWSLNFFGH